MERHGLIVADRSHATNFGIDGQDLGIQPSDECSIDDGKVVGVDV